MNKFLVLFLLLAIILQLCIGVSAHQHGHAQILKRTTHATSKAKAASATTKKAAAATSKAPSSSLPASSAPAASSTAAAGAGAGAGAAPAALKPLAAPILSADCSTCGWLIQQMNPCVSSGSSVQKCMCSQMNINAYASCILCAGTQSMGSTQQVALNDLVSGCSTNGYTVSAAVTNITSTSKFGSSNGTSSSSNGTSTSSSGSDSSYSSYSLFAFVTSLIAVFIGTFF